ncbi:MAG: undecaprenyl-diphosphate phosphatase [Synergistaceae bacterium]|nr:undecaprenyl-diphosphate phosphatase [Synergistaceae bacterium]
MLQTIILGVVQGLCEFLPVSSSGHLALLQNLFGLANNNLVAFDLLLHCATVLVILIFFWRDIVKILTDWFGGCFSHRYRKRPGWLYGWAVLIATFLTGVIGLPLRKAVDFISGDIFYIGLGLIFTALVMLIVPLISKRRVNSSFVKIAVCVGIAQGVAVLPGVSRSGMTIMAGLLVGLGVSEAFRFSFLISVPAVLGASLLEFLKLFKSGEPVFLPDGYIFALISAFVLGLTALGLMRKLVLAGKWGYFGVYCLLIGCIAIFLSL